MTEREKHYVIVPEYAAQPYLAKGYARSEQTAEQRLGLAWCELPTSDRKDLIVIEIAAEQHEQLNRNPRRFAVKYVSDYFVSAVSPLTAELLEEGTYESMVANALRDEGPECISNSELFLTAQDAAIAAQQTIQGAITLHKRAIENLERFLREYT